MNNCFIDFEVMCGPFVVEQISRKRSHYEFNIYINPSHTGYIQLCD